MTQPEPATTAAADGIGDPVTDKVIVEVQGHRGARGLKPESTLPGFETALDLLVPTLELDLHLTADGRVVVWHDPEIVASKCGLTADATTAADPEARIRDSDALQISGMERQVLSQYRCDRNPDIGTYPNQDNQPTPLAGDRFAIVELGELFDFVEAYASSDAKTDEQRANATTVTYNIETKRDPSDPAAIGDDFDGVNPGLFERVLLDEIAGRGLEERVTVQSFDHRSLWAVHSVQPDIRLVALTPGGVPDLVDLAARGATVWSPHHSAITGGVVSDAQAAGLQVVVWTVNDEADMERLIELGVDGIITDRPDVAMSLVAGS